jgi:hypothetical protein
MIGTNEGEAFMNDLGWPFFSQLTRVFSLPEAFSCGTMSEVEGDELSCVWVE